MSRARKAVIAVQLLICAISLALAVDGFRSWVRYRRMDAAAAVAEPLRIAVDLSKPGTYQGSFEQQFRHTCQQQFRLEFTGAPTTEAGLATLLEGMKATLRVFQETGPDVFTATLDEESFVPALATAAAVTRSPGVRRMPFPGGMYQIALKVESPAPALSGKAQFLISRYELCGLEEMRTGILGLAGGFLTVVAMATAFGAFLVYRGSRPRPV